MGKKRTKVNPDRRLVCRRSCFESCDLYWVGVGYFGARACAVGIPSS